MSVNQQSASTTPKRGRPRKRPENHRIYGMTLRINGELRKELRRAAEDETDQRGEVVSIHDVILDAVAAHLEHKRKRARDRRWWW